MAKTALCRASRGQKVTGKVESGCFTSSQQRTSPHFCCCRSCFSRPRLQTAESPAIFSRPAPSDFYERFATWTDAFENDETVIQAINDWFEQLDENIFADGVTAVGRR